MVAALRSAAASLVRARAPFAIARQAAPVARAAVVAPRFTPVRFYAASAGLSKSDIESRIVDVLKTFEKVDPSKVRVLPSFLSRLRVGIESFAAEVTPQTDPVTRKNAASHFFDCPTAVSEGMECSKY